MAESTMLITGAAGGLGSALAMAAAGQGMQLVLLDRRKSALEGLHDRIEAEHHVAPVLQATDLATAMPDELEQVAEAIASELGRLDVLVHTAAHFDGLRPLEQTPPKDWLSALQVNLTAPWWLTVKCLPLLREAGGQVVFCLESMARASSAYWGGYGASKAALQALVQQLAHETEGSGVRVLGVNPGPMATDLRRRAYMAEHPHAQRDPSEVAERILALLSERPVPGGPLVDLEDR